MACTYTDVGVKPVSFLHVSTSDPHSLASQGALGLLCSLSSGRCWQFKRKPDRSTSFRLLRGIKCHEKKKKTNILKKSTVYTMAQHQYQLITHPSDLHSMLSAATSLIPLQALKARTGTLHFNRESVVSLSLKM